MKLVNFLYTNEYDSQAEILVNPAFVVTLRPEGKTKTIISLASKAQVTVDGTIDQVASALCADTSDAVANAAGQDYDQPEESTAALDRMSDTG